MSVKLVACVEPYGLPVLAVKVWYGPEESQAPPPQIGVIDTGADLVALPLRLVRAVSNGLWRDYCQAQSLVAPVQQRVCRQTSVRQANRNVTSFLHSPAVRNFRRHYPHLAFTPLATAGGVRVGITTDRVNFALGDGDHWHSFLGQRCSLYPGADILVGRQALQYTNLHFLGARGSRRLILNFFTDPLRT